MLDTVAFFPYDGLRLIEIKREPLWLRRLWPFRTTMWARATFSKLTYRQEGRPWWEWHQVALHRLRTPLSIAFAEVATHNHFVLDRGGKVFKQTVPVIKLPAGADEARHLELLGVLNSSTACFWIQQVCHNKGRPAADSAGADERYEMRYAHDGTKLRQFPLTSSLPAPRAPSSTGWPPS